MAHLFGGELLQVADMAAREKGIDREEVFDAMEQAIQKAGRTKYGLEHDIRAKVDRRTGEVDRTLPMVHSDYVAFLRSTLIAIGLS